MVILLLLLSVNTYPNGSLIFWEGGLLIYPIERVTNSKLTHVAIILNNDVYEATWPKVRKMPINEYIKKLDWLKRQRFWRKRGFNYFILKPRKSFSQKQIRLMQKYAKSQLGRRYMMRGYWKNKEVRGTMCSQYVGNILQRSKILKSANYKESPISLFKKVEKYYEKKIRP